MADTRSEGDTLAAVSNSVASLLHECYGRGPESVKSYFLDDCLLVIMRGGLTTVEKTLLGAGRGELVREVRQAFQAEMAESIKGRVTEITGRGVVGYQSQIILDPVTLLEFFILEPDDRE